MDPSIDTMHILFRKIDETEQLVKYKVEAAVRLSDSFFWGVRREWRSGIIIYRKNVPVPADDMELQSKIFFEPESTEPLFLKSHHFLVRCFTPIHAYEESGIFPDFIEKASG